MSARSWVAFCLCAVIFGGLMGWGLRTMNSEDRYIRSLAARHEASAIYFNTKLDTMIQENERSYKRGK